MCRHGYGEVRVGFERSNLGFGPEGAGHSGDPDTRGSATAKHSGTFESGGAGRENVVHQQNLMAPDFFGLGDPKRSAQVFLALVARESDLGLSFAGPLEHINPQSLPADHRT